jgi:hypothetical protein
VVVAAGYSAPGNSYFYDRESCKAAQEQVEQLDGIVQFAQCLPMGTNSDEQPPLRSKRK